MNIITLDWGQLGRYDAMQRWCTERVGAGKVLWGVPQTYQGLERWAWVTCCNHQHVTFVFRQEQDLIAFKLRWV